MKINSKKAVSHFFPNPSFEQVYFEAVANSIDAKATEISIEIDIVSFDQADTLTMKISDNGEGFLDENFEKFSKLLETNCPEHKGLGRLVFLQYFDAITVVSRFRGTKKRVFIFNQDFDGDSEVVDVDGQPSGTILEFKNFSGERVKSYKYLRPEDIKMSLISHFFPLLFSLKEDRRSLSIVINLTTGTPNPEQGFSTGRCRFSLADLPVLEQTTIQEPELDLYESINIHYSIALDNERPKSVMTAICVDGRTVPYPIVPEESIPGGYQVLILFASEFFKGKTDTSRQKLDLPNDISEATLRSRLRRELDRIITEKIPRIRDINAATANELDSKYPHLSGYFPDDTVGLIIKDDALKSARERFFVNQKAVLECEDLDEATFQKALDVSARVLTEYILFRTRIIAKLKTMDVGNNEGEIHDVIVPRHTTLRGLELSSDIYNCNVWLLDDKYMSYSTVLSDRTMSAVIREIAVEGEGDGTRPDITLVFSGDPEGMSPVDVVVVELKKHGIGLAKKEEAVSQLKQRARLLLEHYPNKINRVWFYAVTDIDAEFSRSLREERFIELFSQSTMFYKSQPIILASEQELLVDMFVLTYESLIGDAEVRNETFLTVLKNSIRREVERAGRSR